MSSPPLVVPEVQIPASSTKLQTAESSITGAAQGSPVSTSTYSLMSSAGGPGNTVADPVAASQNIKSGPADAITLSAPTSSPSQRDFHGTASDSLQDPVRAKLVTSHGYVAPPPSFSYSVFPRVNSASGIPQQSSSPVQALKLTQQVSPASLQPPVPGQSLVNRPSFSYNIIQPPNSSPAAGQQFQPSTVNNQRPLSIGNPAVPPPASPLLIATCLQPPVPRQAIFPNATISGTMPYNSPQNLPPPPMKLPVLPPKGQLSPSTNFSFSGGSRPTMLEASIKSLLINAGTSDAVSLDTSISSVSTCLDSKSSHDRHASSAAVTGTAASSNLLKTPIPAAVQPTNPGSSSSTVRSTQHNQVLAPPSQSSFANSIPLNVPQQMYPRFPSVPAQNPPAQAHWLNPPPQATGLHCPLLSQYPLALPGPSPFPMRAMTPSSASSLEVRPSGVSLNANCEQVSTSTPESFPVSNTEAGSPTPEAVIEKKINDLLENNNSKSEELDAWTVHKTETGVLYYYNTISGESTYERPSRFKGELEKIALQIIPISWEKISGSNWSLVTTNDGKKYYYNNVNKVSSWQVPAEVLEMRKNHSSNSLREENSCIPADKGTVDSSINAPALQTGGRDSTTLRTPGGQVSASALDLIKKKLQDSATPTVSAPLQTLVSPASDFSGSKTVDSSAKGQQPVTSKEKVKDANGDGNMSDSSSDSDDEESRPTKEERIIQFKEMLKERGVAPFSKWEKELPKIVFDPRFKAVPSYSARRAIFEQFVRTRAEEERKEKKAAQKAAINGFKQLLEEALEDMDHRLDFQTFKRKWGGDPRFEALDRKEREFIFNEVVLLRKKAAEEKIHAERAASVSSFKTMLKERRDLTANSRWSKVKEGLRNDPRYRSIYHEDRETLFNEYITELRAIEHEAEVAAKAKLDEQDKLKEREREMRKRKEREEQEMERIRLKVRRKEAISSYQALLVETIKDLKTSWTESKPKLEKDPQGRASNPDLNQSDAEKLFRDHIKDLYERCAREFRALLAEVVSADIVARGGTEKEKNILTSWSEAKRVLKPDLRYTKLPRKDREALWLRYVEDLTRKQRAVDDPKDVKFDSELNPKRSPRRFHSRR